MQASFSTWSLLVAVVALGSAASFGCGGSDSDVADGNGGSAGSGSPGSAGDRPAGGSGSGASASGGHSGSSNAGSANAGSSNAGAASTAGAAAGGSGSGGASSGAAGEDGMGGEHVGVGGAYNPGPCGADGQPCCIPFERGPLYCDQGLKCLLNEQTGEHHCEPLQK